MTFVDHSNDKMIQGVDMITSHDIDVKYRALQDATDQYASAVERYEVARMKLDAKKAMLVHEGKVEGSNQAKRDAHLKQLTEEEEAEVYMLDMERKAYRTILDLAEISVKWLHAHMRLMDLELRATEVGHLTDLVEYAEEEIGTD